MGLISQRDAIETILTAVQVDAAAAFNEVKTAPPRESESFTGYPSVYFYYDTYESDYATNEENRRLTNWVIVIEDFTQNLSSEDQYARVYKTIDATVQAFDESYDLNGAVDFVVPTPGQTVQSDTESGVTVWGQINLRCWQDVDVRV